MKKILRSFIAMCSLCVVAYAQAKLQVSVSIPPLYFFVKEIAKSHVNVTVIVPQNKNAETYEPTFKDMQTIANSDIFVGIGMPFETIWLPKILKANTTQTNLDVVLLHDVLKQQNFMHLWLSINNAKDIVMILADTFSKRDSQHKSFYYDNAKKLLQDMNALERKITAYLQKMPYKDFIVYHPLFDSTSVEYGLKEHALEQHGKTYGVQEILALADFGKKAGIKKVFAEYANRDIKSLANAMQAQVVLINPMSSDYIKNLESIFIEISKSYE